VRARARRISFWLLLGWLFATGHVLWSHGGMTAERVLMIGQEHEDDDEDADDVPIHHHGPAHHHDLDFAGVTPAVEQIVKVPAPNLAALDFSMWLLPAILAPREIVAKEPRLGWEHAPPDRRQEGWLQICRSALPVRAPARLA